MKIECKKKDIKKAVSQAEKATGKNPTLSVLSAILLETKKGGLFITTTNLDVGLEISIPAKVKKEGRVAVPGYIFSQFLSSVGDEGTITIEEKGGNVEVKTKHNNALIKCVPNEDFPSLPKLQDGKSFSINTKKLTNGLKSVIYSASTSDIKPELSSVYIQPDGQYIVFVSTDTFRLAEKRVEVRGVSDFHGILLPLKNAIIMVKVLEDTDTEVTIEFDKNQISIKTDRMYFTSRIIDGVFPDYKQIIPKQHNLEATVIKQDFITALKTSNIFSDRFNQIIFSINPTKKTFELKTKNNDLGESVVTLDAALEGEKEEMRFNQRYIQDVFQSVSSDSLVLQSAGEDKPLVMRGVGDKTFTYLVMPMNR